MRERNINRTENQRSYSTADGLIDGWMAVDGGIKLKLNSDQPCCQRKTDNQSHQFHLNLQHQISIGLKLAQKD